MKPRLYAVIGVAIEGDRALYFHRSPDMKNYPDLWSLLSIQTPGDLNDRLDLEEAQVHFDRLAEERLGGARVQVTRHMGSRDSDRVPIEEHTFLHMYEVELDETRLVLNPQYYLGAEWLTQHELAERNRNDAPCGLCLQMWTDYAMGLADENDND